MKDNCQSKAVPRGTRTIWRYLGALFLLFTFAIGNVWGVTYASSTFFQAVPKGDTPSITPTEARDASADHVKTKDCTSAFTLTTGGSAVVGLYSTGSGTTQKKWTYSSDNKGSKTNDAAEWIVFYSTEQFKAGDSIVVANGNATGSNKYTIVGVAANNTAKYNDVTAVSSPSTATPAKNTNYYYILPSNFVASNYIVIRNAGTSAYFGGLYAYHAAASADKAPEITAPTTDQSAAYTVGDVITALSVTATGTPTPTYQWYYNSSASTTGATSLGTGAQTASYTPSNSEASDLYYYCVATNSAGSATSHYFHVTVNSSSAPTHGISYDSESLKGQSVSGYPTEFTEGVGKPASDFPALVDVTDYHFKGWSPASIGTDVTDDVTMYATWVAAYNVTFDAGVGSGTVPASFQKWEGAKFNLPGQGSMVAPSGKVFDGWKANGTGDKLAANAEYTMGDDAVQFVAQWKNTPTVLFHYQWAGTGSAPAKDANLSATGGSILVSTYGSNNLGIQSLSSYASGTPDDMKVVATSSMNFLKFGNNDPYMELSLTTGKFKTGDTVYICGDAQFYISSSVTTSTPSGDLGTLATSGTSSNNAGVGYIVLPQVASEDAEFDHIYISRKNGSSAYFAAVKVIRPAQKDVKSTTYDLTAVKINGTAISAANLATLKTADAYLLDLASAYGVAPVVKFARETTITYDDDSEKVTNDTITVTASEVSSKWQAQATIGTITYTVKMTKVVSDDATLSSLTYQLGSATPVAISLVTDKYAYAVELPFGTTSVPAVAGTASDPKAKSVEPTQATTLVAPNNVATIVVTAEDNTTVKEYTITFTVAASKDLLLVFKLNTTSCSSASTASYMLSDNAAVSSYINKITFENVEGSGDNGKEAEGSLDVGKKAGNMFTLSAKPGYAMKAMTFAAKIQDANCEYSLNGGAWQTLTSTGQSADKCYEVFADAEVHEFRLRSTGTSGVWIRNMELAMIQACTPVKLNWTAEPAAEYEVGKAASAIAATANNGGAVAYSTTASDIVNVAANGALTIAGLGSATLKAATAEGDGTAYCANGGADIVISKAVNTYYLVKLDAQNETAVTDVKYYSGDEAIALPTPSYSGYNFQGWFDAATGGNKITETTIIPTASRTVYAQWEEQCAGPTITVQPASANYFTGRTSVALTGAATAGNGGALTYTWYSCDDAERNNPVALSGAPTPSTAVVGTQYYYFTVTEAGCDVVKTSDVAVITVADKDMLCLVKANVGDKTLTYDNTSFYAENKVTLAENDLIKGKDESYYAGYKFQSGAILQVGLKEASFEENDIIEVYVGAVANNGGYQKMRAFNADEAVLANIVAESAEIMVEGVNRIVLTEDAADLYFMRKDDYSKWNPHVAYVAVYRAYPVPVLTAMTVNGSAATISGTNVAATIASNAELASLTIVPTFMSNKPSETNGALGGPWVENENVYTNSYVVTDKDGDTNTYTITLTRDVEITSVTISGETTVAAESQITLTATVLPNNVLNKEVTWSSSDETKAVVDANGIVTGKAAGAVTITATAVADNTKKGTYDITVTPFIGTKYAYWFTKTADIPSDLANDDGTVFENAPSYGSNINASMTVEINGVDREFNVTGRSGDSDFGTFHVPAGFTADLYVLAVGSGSPRTLKLQETTTSAVYKSTPEEFGDSPVKLVFNAIPAGNYTFDKGGKNSRVFMMVAALNSYPLTSITLSDMTMRIGNTGKPAMTLDHAKAAITSQTWSIVENNAAGTTISASTGVITAGTTAGTVTVKVVAEDAMGNEVTSNTCTVTIVEIYERVDVTGDITWNWNAAGNTENVSVATASGLALANYISGADWQKINGTHGDFAYNTNASGSYQGKGKLAFHTTVPGIVKVTARRISNDANIMLGDRVIGLLTSSVQTFPAMYVPAGEVEIIADATEGMRVTKVEFKASYEHNRENLNPNNIGTLCWTNNAILGGATLYEFAGKNEYNYLVFDEVEENRLEAGKPYIFMPENGSTEIRVYNTDNEAALTEDQAPVNHMYGTITGKTLVPGVDDNMYYFSASHIWAVKDFTVNINVPAYYCYVDYEAVLNDNPAPAPAPGRRRVTMGVQGEQVVTGINAIEASEKPMKLLINGQIFILRGEKMFDATGRLVK